MELMDPLVLFFEPLCTQNILMTMAVSRAWFKAASSAELFLDVSIDAKGKSFNDANCEWILRLARNRLRSIAVLNSPLLTEKGLQLLIEQPMLKSVCLEGCICVRILHPIIPPKVDLLILKGTSLADHELGRLLENKPGVNVDVFACSTCSDVTSDQGICDAPQCDQFEGMCLECAAEEVAICANKRCEKKLCLDCSSWGNNYEGMVYCTNDKCNKGLCFDCSCWGNGIEGMVYCSNDKCNKGLCFDCSCWGNGTEGMVRCSNYEKCSMELCFDCSCWGNGTQGMVRCSNYEKCSKELCFDCSCSRMVLREDGESVCYGCESVL